MKSCLRTLVHLQLLALLWVVPTACEHDDTAESSEPVQATMAFALQPQSQAATRMSEDATQTGSSFRGWQDIRVISFEGTENIESGDAPISFFIKGEGEHPFDRAKERFYFFEHCNFVSKTGSLLVYGRAKPISSEKAKNGSIVAAFGTNHAPADISFRLEPIWDGKDDDNKPVAPPAAQDICDYLNGIAKATVLVDESTFSWHTTSNSRLKPLFQSFVNYDEEDSTEPYKVLPGSAACVKAWVSAFYQKIDELHFGVGTTEEKMREAILQAIKKDVDFDETTHEVTSLGNGMENYPASIGLPDGAAVVRWTGSQFEPQIQTTTLANINGINRFCYPAEIYYYANSRIKTSNSAEGKIPADNSTKVWSAELDDYKDGGVVNRDTRAVAMIDPLQYGVACLQTRLLSLESDLSLKDAKDEIVKVEKDYFPATGIIVAGQRPVGFDFMPKLLGNEYSDAEACFIYDNWKAEDTQDIQISRASTSPETPPVTSTLVLQNGNREKVKLFVEFENNSGKSFYGNGGIVYPCTKFYLACELEVPAKDNKEDYEERVFTRDYITSVNLKLNETSMAKAYNVLPDLLQDRLEFGIMVQTDWIQATPTVVQLK